MPKHLQNMTEQSLQEPFAQRRVLSIFGGYSLNELKGIFTTEEFIAITSSQNYMTLVPEYQANKAVLIAHLRDQERLQEGISDYGANLEDIERKINLMTAAQVFFLQDEIAIFWDGGDSDLHEFVKIYT